MLYLTSDLYLYCTEHLQLLKFHVICQVSKFSPCKLILVCDLVLFQCEKKGIDLFTLIHLGLFQET